jgi:hypothetical protein
MEQPENKNTLIISRKNRKYLFMVSLKNICYILIFCQQILIQLFTKILAPMSHNVPAVYDGFASPNKGFAKQRPGLAKCGWREAWEWSVAE